jgi:hypothetical protein
MAAKPTGLCTSVASSTARPPLATATADAAMAAVLWAVAVSITA